MPGQLQPGYRLAVVALVLAVVVVLLGAWTRLADAGLGCPDWPGCYGLLTVPDSPTELQMAARAYPDSPVDSFKAWVEMIHRYFAGFLALLIYGLGWLAYRWRQRPGYPWKLVAILAALVTLQAAFGAWTVTFKLWPQVVVAHLLGGFALLSLLTLLVLRLAPATGRAAAILPGRVGLARRLGVLSLLLVVLQVALGGWVSANYAGLACPDFPTCQGRWWPPADHAAGFDLTMSPGGNHLGGLLEAPARIAIHHVHRLGAWVLTLALLVVGVLLWRMGVTRHWILAMWGALGLQVLLGAANIWWQLPLYLALAHNAGAALLLLVLVGLNHSFFRDGRAAR